jgi:biotin carboxyl carrier protein
MRKFVINVNGKSYEVEVEEVKDGVVQAPRPVQPQQPVQSAVQQPIQKKVEKPAQKGSGSGLPVSSPMPGTIMSVNVKVGDKVNEGDILCILEAMKMENEIVAAKAGEITSVNVSQGATVDTGDILLTIA